MPATTQGLGRYIVFEVFLRFFDGFYRQGPGGLLMLEKPHDISFPEETFTVKEGFGPNRERESLNPASGS